MTVKTVWARIETLVIVVILLLILQYGQTMYHEQAHKKIFEYSGVQAKIHPGVFVWTTEGIENETAKCGEKCMELHALNEIVGYHMQVPVLILSFMMAWYMVKK